MGMASSQRGNGSNSEKGKEIKIKNKSLNEILNFFLSFDLLLNIL
jgi:hypothetical protein